MENCLKFAWFWVICLQKCWFSWIVANNAEESVDDNDATDAEASCADGEEGDEVEEDEKSKEIIGPSDAMKELIRVLEFNAVDMYR